MTPNLTDGAKSAFLQSKLRIGFANILLVIFSIAISLPLIEGACRFYVDVVLAGGPLPRWEFRAARPPPYQDADYLTPEFISEVQFGLKAFWEPGKVYLQLNDFSGKYFNVAGGLRLTTDQPPNPKRRILLFGGSNLFSQEVPDWYTIPIFLQRLLNSTCAEKIAVFNYGTPAMNAQQQTLRLKNTRISAGDIVIYYDGANEIYYSIFFGTRGYRGQQESFRPVETIPAWRRELYVIFYPWREASRIAWVLSDLYDRGVPTTVTDGNVLEHNLQTSGPDFRNSLVGALQFVTSKQGYFFHFLQPHLFATPLSTSYRRELAANFLQTPPGLDIAFRIGYPGLRDAIVEAQWAGVISFDLSMILAVDAVPKEVFLDFAHVNHVANEILARTMFADIRGDIGGCGR